MVDSSAGQDLVAAKGAASEATTLTEWAVALVAERVEVTTPTRQAVVLLGLWQVASPTTTPFENSLEVHILAVANLVDSGIFRLAV